MPRTTKATFAVGIFEALEALRGALIDLVSLGYEQNNFILLHPEERSLDETEFDICVKDLVTPVWSRPAQKAQHVEFDLPEAVSDRATCDITLVLSLQSWLSSNHFECLLEALRNKKNVLFIRIPEQRQIAPTCSILLAHCTHKVNTHEVSLDGRYWKA